MSNEQLVIQIKAGINTRDNMDKLCRQLERFIHSSAVRYHGLAELEDLKQEGYLSLYKAIEGWNPEEGTLFLSYAGICIRRAMERYIGNHGSSIRISEHNQALVGKYKKLQNTYLQKYKRNPAIQEIAENLKLKESQAAELIKTMDRINIKSLDESLPEEPETTLKDAIADSRDIAREAMEMLDRERMKAVLWSLVDSLEGVQPEIIRNTYVKGLSKKEAARLLKMDEKVYKSLEAKAMRQLRKPENVNKLKPYYDEYLEVNIYRHYGLGTVYVNVKMLFFAEIKMYVFTG